MLLREDLAALGSLVLCRLKIVRIANSLTRTVLCIRALLFVANVAEYFFIDANIQRLQVVLHNAG